MQFRNSFNIFKPKSYFFIYLFLQSFDFQKISKQLYLEFYSSKKSKNNFYNLSSMLRLFLILNLFSKPHSYSSHSLKLDLSKNLIELCGFFLITTCTIYFYFLKRIQAFPFNITKYQANIFS